VSQDRHHICNFGPADREYYEECVKIAASIGLESWISAPVLPGGSGDWPELSGFYVKGGNLGKFWEKVNRFIGNNYGF